MHREITREIAEYCHNNPESENVKVLMRWLHRTINLNCEKTEKEINDAITAVEREMDGKEGL